MQANQSYTYNTALDTRVKSLQTGEKATLNSGVAFFVTPASNLLLNRDKINKTNNTMVKTNQFSAKVQYVTPSCKSVVLRSRQPILAGSYGDGKASNPWETGGDDVHDYSGEDNLL